jgi:hypothetical protein
MSLDPLKVIDQIADAAKKPPVLRVLLLGLVVGFGGGYGLATLIDAGTRGALEKSLDGEQRHSAGLQQDYEQRLKTKDDLLDDYRRRLQIVAPKGGELAQLTNAELKARGLQFVSELRKWYGEVDREDRARSNQIFQAMINAKGQDDKDQIRNELIQMSFDFMRYYDNNFRVTAVLLRDEITSRLPQGRRNQAKAALPFAAYEAPTNLFGIDYVATNLELLVKYLD